ncbi:MAG TPA: TraB/GumN family protein [Allosphingosinicella sp.]|nr:TraB/GumN family protein [Allosphingosinicella sp.]
MRPIATAGKMWRALAGALAAALLLVQAPVRAEAPAPQTAAASAPRPAIWLLEDADTRIYLFGTTHIFERGLNWRSPRLEAVIREADELVMETADEEELDDDLFSEWLFMPKSVPILSRVSADRREPLARLIAASGVPVEAWDMMHSWAAGMLLMGLQMGGGEDPLELSGAEIELTAAFRAAGKPISAVETTEQQIGFFRSLSRPAQRAFLDSIVDAAAAQVDAAAADAAAGTRPAGDEDWLRGNVEGLARETEAFPPELYEVLLSRRNRAWTDWLAQRLERPGTVLFAVGAAHLAGRDSVQTLLAARGLNARRID